MQVWLILCVNLLNGNNHFATFSRIGLWLLRVYLALVQSLDSLNVFLMWLATYIPYIYIYMYKQSYAILVAWLNASLRGEMTLE